MNRSRAGNEPAVAPAAVRAVLFDLGGTCLTIDHPRVAQALAARGHTPPEDWVSHAEAGGRVTLERVLRGGGSAAAQWRAFFDGLFLGAGAAPADLDALFEEIADFHRRQHLWNRPMPGMPETLRALAGRGYRLAAVSNSDGRAEWLLGRLGLAHEFEFIVDSHDIGCEKPDPRIFHEACTRLGLTPSACAYVGDVLAIDYEGARRAGLWPVLLDVYGAYGPEIQPRAAEPAQLLGLFPERPDAPGSRG